MATQLKVFLSNICRLKKLDQPPKLKEYPLTHILKVWVLKKMAMHLISLRAWLDKY
jgi:hypothetical protein